MGYGLDEFMLGRNKPKLPSRETITLIIFSGVVADPYEHFHH